MTPESTFDRDEILDSITVEETRWVESIALPTYPLINGSDDGVIFKSKFNRLQRNYAFIKHMMNDLNLKLNQDYIIIRDTYNVGPAEKIVLKFNSSSKQYASMAVLQWGNYKNAKIESNL